jgi:hypothetical protein
LIMTESEADEVLDVLAAAMTAVLRR